MSDTCEHAWTDFEGEHSCAAAVTFGVWDTEDPEEMYGDVIRTCSAHIGAAVRGWGGNAIVRAEAS
jgi:hypothetical protein